MAADLAASDLTVVIGFGAAGAVLVALVTFVVGLIVDASGDGDAVDDVQRFIELSAAARYSLLPRGPILSDPDGEASAAISRLLGKKEEARQALWSSREPNQSRHVEPVPRAAQHPQRETIPRCRSVAGLISAHALQPEKRAAP
jgi:hypothetical protein